MFDCPEQNHTSPTNTLLNLIVLFAEILSWYGPPAFDGLKTSRHEPSGLALVLRTSSLKIPVTFSLGAALPKRTIFCSCCKTI